MASTRKKSPRWSARFWYARRLSGERAAFVNDANTRTSGEFNPAETAQAIANQVTAQDLNLIQESLLAQTDETKTESARALLLKESSVPLVRRLISLLGPNEQGRYAGTPGQASKAALELVVDVLKAIVIKDKNLRDDVLLSTSGELGRVGQALEKSIARLALLEKSNEQMALGGTLTAALNKVREIRNDPELRKNWRNQIPAAFNAEEQIVNDLVAFIMDNLAKPNNITALLNQYAIDAMKEPGTGGQQGLFGGRTREELLTETIAASREGKLAEAGIPMPFSEAQDVNTGIFVDRMMDKGSPVKGGRTFTVNYRMADGSMQTYRITMTQRLKSVRKGSHPEEFQWILKSAEKIADDGTATVLQLDKAGIPEGHGNSQRAAEMALESVVEPLVGTRWQDER